MEAQEILRNGEIFSDVYSKRKRHKLAGQNPTITYSIREGDSAFDRYGNEWVVVAKRFHRHFGGEDTLPTIHLAQVPDGEECTIDPYDEQALDLHDFSRVSPVPEVIDGAPIHDDPKFSPIGRGESSYDRVVLQKIPVKEKLGKGFDSNRYLLVPVVRKPTRSQRLDIGAAMWKQAGRAVEIWNQKTLDEKLRFYDWGHYDFHNVEIRNVRGKVNLTYGSQKNRLSAVDFPIGEKSIAKYAIT